jgi:hypothetical protein
MHRLTQLTRSLAAAIADAFQDQRGVIALSGRRYRRRKKEVIHMDGYYLDNVNALVPAMDRTDETFHVFGSDSPDTDVQNNYGTLQLDALDKESNNVILDLLTNQNPDLPITVPRQYRVPDLGSVDVWMNIKDSGNTKYLKSYLYANWTPGMPLPSGAPNDKAIYSLTGNSDLPRQFQNCWIDSIRLASGAANIGLTPIQVPGETVGMFAVRIKAIQSGAGLFDQEVIIPAPSMVSSAGAVSWTPILNAVTTLSAVTHAFFLVLQSGTGVYPANLHDKLRA